MITNNNGNGVARDWWARTAVGLGGLLTGMTIAWFTAFEGRGVTRPEMELYVRDYSPYVIDKSGIEARLRIEDIRISKTEDYIEQEKAQNGNGHSK